MSQMFGVLQPGGTVVDRSRLVAMSYATSGAPPDATHFHTAGRFGVGTQLRYVHQRSLTKSGIFADAFHCVSAFEGRLDNRAALSQELGFDDAQASDSEIVAKAFRLYGEECFAHLKGDWAIALWSQDEETLFLARDHAGTRPLYYRHQGGEVLWASSLATILEELPTARPSIEFARAYLAGQRIGDRTPFEGIHAVPSACVVRLARGGCLTKRHWTPLRESEARYASDEAFEEHFLDLFSQAVSRRVAGAEYPVIAELSGGMDSSSIVCMADRVCQTSGEVVDLIKTISYFDDAEPNWNERPYFTAVEKQRGQPGVHVEFHLDQERFESPSFDFGIEYWPGTTQANAKQRRIVEDCLRSVGARSVLSGIGGDELLGGVPYAIPELADYLRSFEISNLRNQSMRWCLESRRPLLGLAQELLSFTARMYLGGPRSASHRSPWIREDKPAVEHDCSLFTPSFAQRMSARPSAIANSFAWQTVVESLASNSGRCRPEFEYAYPYLDKDLVEFLLSLPREQLVRPGRRRSLMRRAMRGTVPVEILERRRKAFAIRGPLRSMQESAPCLASLFCDSRLAELGLIEPAILSDCVAEVVQGANIQWWPAIVRAALYEIWLRSLFPTETRLSKQATSSVTERSHHAHAPAD